MALLNQEQQDYYNGDDFGGYQFISLDDVITNFTIAYVGEDKIISKVKRTDIAFHAQRALAELSFDTLKSIKSQEITLPASNTMMLPQDYVNYTKICWVDNNGIERPLYPTRHTSNPPPITQTGEDYNISVVGTLTNGSNTVVLDGSYTNIMVGMVVTAPNIPTEDSNGDPITCVVGGTSNNNDITTITLLDETNIIGTAGTAVNATYTGDETLTFSNPDGSLIKPRSSYVLEGLSWTTSGTAGDDDKITAASTSDVAQLSVGMLVSSSEFEVGTTVTSVNGVIITVSSDSINNTTDEITFFSDPSTSSTWGDYSAETSNTEDALAYNHDTDVYDLNIGQRFGLEPQASQVNGTYYIDNLKGKIHFSSNCTGKTVILKYISDGLGTDEEMLVHKFAEEAMYKSIAYAILSTSIHGQPLVPRFKKEKFAAIRQAKLRLSNIKIEELAQTMRGKSKWIKH